MSHSVSKIGGLLAKAIFGLGVAGCALPAMQYVQVATLRASASNGVTPIAPRDARVVASTLGRRFEENPEFKPSVRDLANMRAAITAQPLEPKLISVLGLAYEAAGNTQKASNLMELADRASRRDVISGLYLIETASTSGDVRKTLRHYDAVLSTQPELYPTLLPILASAIRYPEVRSALRKYLEGAARWSPSFVAAAADAAGAEDLKALLLPLPKKLSTNEYAPSLARVIFRLALQGDKEAAAHFAVAIIPGFSSKELSDIRFSAKTLDKRLGSFAWSFPPIEGIQVEPSAANSLQIRAEPLSRGMTASRDLLLGEGWAYELVQRIEHGASSNGISARWSAECISLNGSQRFWEQKLPTNGQQKVYRSVINVPTNCSITRLALSIEGPDSQMPGTLVISGASLQTLK